jgi:hypothetical protein
MSPGIGGASGAARGAAGHPAGAAMGAAGMAASVAMRMAAATAAHLYRLAGDRRHGGGGSGLDGAQSLGGGSGLGRSGGEGGRGDTGTEGGEERAAMHHGQSPWGSKRNRVNRFEDDCAPAHLNRSYRGV